MVTVGPRAASAAAIDLDVGNCTEDVHLVARGVPLSTVLTRLSSELGFRLHLRTAADRAVDGDYRHPPAELLALLTAGENVIVEDAPDPQCPGRPRVVQVWILPKGENVPPRRVLSPQEEIYRRTHGLALDDPPQFPDPPEKP